MNTPTTVERSGAASADKNPIIVAREGQNLDRNEAALRMGVNYHSLTRLERAHVVTLSEIWRVRFESIGIDFDELKAAYDDWRQSKMAPVGKAAANG